MTELLLIYTIVFVAGLVQGLTGFGSVLISLPLLALVMDIKEVIPLVSLFALCINIALVWQLRAHIPWKQLGVLLVATIPGLPIGVYLLRHVSPDLLTLALGAIIATFCCHQFMINPVRRQIGTGMTILAGFLAGCLGGSIGANGPPIIIYSTMQPWPKDRTKACLASYFLFAGVGISTSQAIGGMLTPPVLHNFILGIPALLIGIFAGTLLYKRITGDGYRKMAMILIFLLGLLMLYRGVDALIS